jgi:hypothetical protein
VCRAARFEVAAEVETEEEEAFVSPLTGTTEVLRFMLGCKAKQWCNGADPSEIVTVLKVTGYP